MIEFCGWLEQNSKAFADVLVWLQAHVYEKAISYKEKPILKIKKKSQKCEPYGTEKLQWTMQIFQGNQNLS